MAKTKPLPEGAEAAAIVPTEASAAPALTEESWEQAQQRKFREDFLRRNAAALAARSEILTANGLLDDTAGIDPAEALRRCCS